MVKFSFKLLLIFFLLAIIISVGINWIILIVVYKPYLDYDPTLYQPYDVQTKLKVEMWNGSIGWLDIELLKYNIDNNKTMRTMSHVYDFQSLNVGLDYYISDDNTTTLFAYVYVTFIISKEAYKVFPQKLVHWEIEDKEDTILTNNFQLSDDGNTYYFLYDVTKHVNRLTPPKRIDASILLTNRIPEL